MDSLRIECKKGEIVEMKKKLAKSSKVFRVMLLALGDDKSNDTVPLPEVDFRTLKDIVKWAEHHRRDNRSFTDRGLRLQDVDDDDWDTDFLEKLDVNSLVKLINAANYLQVDPLYLRACKTASRLVAENSVDEIRRLFRAENDFDPKEEEALREDIAWAE